MAGEWTIVYKKKPRQEEVSWEETEEKRLDVRDFTKTIRSERSLSLLCDGYAYHSVIKSTRYKRTTSTVIAAHIASLPGDCAYKYLVIESTRYRDVIVYSKKVAKSRGSVLGFILLH